MNIKKQKAAKAAKSPFVENKQWEHRLNEKLRSGNEVRMVSPVSGLNYTDDKIEFEWQNSPNGKLFLGILSNQNKEVLYKEVSGNKVRLSSKEIKLLPGLYYWVLESEEEVLTVGKFLYRKK